MKASQPSLEAVQIPTKDIAASSSMTHGAGDPVRLFYRARFMAWLPDGAAICSTSRSMISP
ncbi:hypothetical protein F3P66_24230 (plasmid) [Agrobacterium fabrum]|uniref:Uncharacterized protein n=1 Tax=Agrobacterium fabrum (strain C58 / ATCC 33970) TaxID=176299 RepID=Q8UJG2_AGRFC|nr:hypothetical protein Atu5515 [Agrobacterium fabrum str. C58]QRM62519.1 hypothetical protein F3P66_24230 [Agrobacterium fabrum]TRB28278.1 hypothetical protein EXN51_16750 [Agrobacterium fabrum]